MGAMFAKASLSARGMAKPVNASAVRPAKTAAANLAKGEVENRAVPRTDASGGLVRIDSKEYAIANISTGGFLLKPYEGDLIKHQRFYLTLVFSAGENTIEFAADARVARVGPEGLGAYFLNLRPDAQWFLQEFLQSRLAGAPAK